MLKEFTDFIQFESQYGIRVLLTDLISVNKIILQDYYLNNILRFAQKRHLKFTFFVSAKNLHKRIKLIKLLKIEGHEIASHGYNHVLLNKLSLKELEWEFKQAQEEFQKYRIKVSGFRAPFLSLNESMLQLLKRYNFRYSSNKIGGKEFRYNNGIKEIPIVNPYDWYGLVVQKQNIEELLQYWKEREGCCYLFHPWIINKYFDKIMDLLGENKDYRIIAHLNHDAVSVSFDVY